MIDVSKATRYIAVAQFSDITREEWRQQHPSYQLPPPEYNDYALLKVLYMLRKTTKNKAIPIHPFKHEEQVTGLDFSSLQNTDVIFIVGHGDGAGLYSMGPDAKEGMRRLVDILTKDGNLKQRRKDKKIIIALLSCRAGLGLHKGLARKLFNAVSIRTTVGGPQGFTFGSIRTVYLALNEVLIRGIPWFMEYPKSITPEQAEQATSAREGKTITIGDKQAEIDKFMADKKELEDDMKDVATNLRSTDVSSALDEIDSKHRSRWLGLARAQFELYATAKKRGNLEFDMWYDLITEGYVWTDSSKVTDAQANALLGGELTPTDDGLRSIR